MFTKKSRDHLLSRDKYRLWPWPWSISPSKTRFWKNSYDERQDTVLRKIPAPSEKIKRDRRVVTPQADRSEKM